MFIIRRTPFSMEDCIHTRLHPRCKRRRNDDNSSKFVPFEQGHSSSYHDLRNYGYLPLMFTSPNTWWGEIKSRGFATGMDETG